MATGAVNKFLDDLSNWYLRRSRRRFWAKAGASEASDADKNAAYTTLYTVLVTLLRLLAPFVPFVTEAMYQNLIRSIDASAPVSVHHNDWPTVDPSSVDSDLTREMGLAMQLVSLGHAARNQANRKLRQPLQEVAFVVTSQAEEEVVNQYAELIREELNVKQVRLLDAAQEVVSYQLKPLPRQLGQKYGSQFPAIRKAIVALDPNQTAAQLINNQPLDVKIGEETIQVLPEEVEVRIEAREGFSTAAEGGYLAALVTDITPELRLEGLAREFVRRVQDLRKSANLQVDDRVNIQFQASQELSAAVESHHDYIESETLAVSLVEVEKPSGAFSTQDTFDGEKVKISIQKA
jgi:isoleucyl-tRNA synthetase